MPSLLIEYWNANDGNRTPQERRIDGMLRLVVAYGATNGANTTEHLHNALNWCLNDYCTILFNLSDDPDPAGKLTSIVYNGTDMSVDCNWEQTDDATNTGTIRLFVHDDINMGPNYTLHLASSGNPDTLAEKFYLQNIVDDVGRIGTNLYQQRPNPPPPTGTPAQIRVKQRRRYLLTSLMFRRCK